MNQEISADVDIINKLQLLLNLYEKVEHENSSFPAPLQFQQVITGLICIVIVASICFCCRNFLYLKQKSSSIIKPSAGHITTTRGSPKEPRKSFSPTTFLLKRRRSSLDTLIDPFVTFDDLSMADATSQLSNFTDLTATERLRLLSNFMSMLNYSMIHMLIAMQDAYKEEWNVIDRFDYERLAFVPTKIEIAFFLLSYTMDFDEFLERYVSAEKIKKFKCEENISDYVIKIIYDINGVH